MLVFWWLLGFRETSHPLCDRAVNWCLCSGGYWVSEKPVTHCVIEQWTDACVLVVTGCSWYNWCLCLYQLMCVFWWLQGIPGTIDTCVLVVAGCSWYNWCVCSGGYRVFLVQLMHVCWWFQGIPDTIDVCVLVVTGCSWYNWFVCSGGYRVFRVNAWVLVVTGCSWYNWFVCSGGYSVFLVQLMRVFWWLQGVPATSQRVNTKRFCSVVHSQPES